MIIRTSFQHSAPDHSRWSAVTDNYDGPGSPIGSGATEIAAIRDLLDDIEDREEAEWQAQRADDAYDPHEPPAWGRLP